mmetsp:Transcript_123269/g.227088  ORF Transcript_123269/g.227088 Transcript_123269/m.227088 type:complete len:80 (-) Transcript_123269:395-634(-)
MADVITARPFQHGRRVGSGNGRCHCPMGCKRRGLSLDVISFNAAISACDKGLQWQRVTPVDIQDHARRCYSFCMFFHEW